MDSEYLNNPLNRRKKKYKYYLRKIENFFKKILIYIIIFPILFPFLVKNYFLNINFLLKDFVNQNGAVFLIFILKEIKNHKFSIKVQDFDKVLSRFGFFFLLKNFSINFKLKKLKSISFKDKNSYYYINSDYFYYFDKDIKELTDKFILPFYLPKYYYLKNKYKINQRFIDNKKKFKIIFSGTIHDEWYGDLNFINGSNKKFLTRQEILTVLLSNFKDKILIIKNQSDLKKIENTKKKILILETNPDLSLRKKNFTRLQHLELISKSNFFLCMPGTSMPLCYHLIESCLVGTVPILSCNDYIYPKFRDNEAITFFTKKELIAAVKKALLMNNTKYDLMKNNIIKYYRNNLLPKNIAEKLISDDIPKEVFVNLDHISTNERKKRIFYDQIS